MSPHIEEIWLSQDVYVLSLVIYFFINKLDERGKTEKNRSPEL